MTRAPEVSVVIPTHNRRALLARTVSCALAQRDVDLEVVVVDDGSSDGTAAMLRDLEDRRLRVVRNEQPRMVAGARNQGIEASCGEWVAFLDDDDLWAPDKLTRQLEAARRAGASWAYCGYVQVDRAMRVVSGGPPPSPQRVRAQLPYTNQIPAGSSVVLARRALLERLGGFDTALHKLEDWDLWIRLAAAAPPAYVPEPLVAYVEHPQMASLQGGDFMRELDVIDRRYRSLRDGGSVDRRGWYRWFGWRALQAGSRSGALRAYARAVGTGDLSSLARAALALASPRLGVRLARRYRDREWTAIADEWLRPYRTERPASAARADSKSPEC